MSEFVVGYLIGLGFGWIAGIATSVFIVMRRRSLTHRTGLTRRAGITQRVVDHRKCVRW